MVDCKICGSEFKNLKSLSQHFNLKHNINAKEYYDKFLKKENDGKCSVCGEPTTYRNMGTGYLNNCSIECRSLNKNIKRDSLKGKTQSKETIQKRIKNTDQKLKEATRKKTMLKRYGVDNPAKIEEVKNILSSKMTGKKQTRTLDWQNKIIESKRKNGTLSHKEETKLKISNKVNEFYEKNLDREKYVTYSNNVKHISGWYKGIFFRSSLELSFLIRNDDKKISSCEIKRFAVLYNFDGKTKTYYPDYTDGNFIYEIKPSKLLNFNVNPIKITQAKIKFGDKYKVITETECPYVTKNTIDNFINDGVVKLIKNSKDILKKYKH